MIFQLFKCYLGKSLNTLRRKQRIIDTRRDKPTSSFRHCIWSTCESSSSTVSTEILRSHTPLCNIFTTFLMKASTKTQTKPWTPQFLNCPCLILENLGGFRNQNFLLFLYSLFFYKLASLCETLMIWWCTALMKHENSEGVHFWQKTVMTVARIMADLVSLEWAQSESLASDESAAGIGSAQLEAQWATALSSTAPHRHFANCRAT